MRKTGIDLSNELDVLIHSHLPLTKGELNNMTIFDMAAEVVKRSSHCRLCDMFFDHNSLLLDTLAEKMNLTPFQAIIVSIMLDNDTSMSTSDIARYLNCGAMELRKRQEEFDRLLKQHIISRETRTRRVILSAEAVAAYCRNEPFVYVIPENLTPEKLLFTAEKRIESCSKEYSYTDYEPMWEEICELFIHNQHIPFTNLLMGTDNISTTGKVILLYMAAELFIHNRSVVHLQNLDNEFNFDAHIAVCVEMEMDELERNGYIEAECMEGMRNDEEYRLSDMACTDIFVDLGLEKMIEDRYNVGMIDPESLTEKRLFYNSQDEEQVAQLNELLKQENFEQVCKRLESEGLRKGFACLFYGAPGCGKTETVLQIARATGRSIVSVNVSDIMSKWVGDSEKHIKNVFTKYREKVKRLDKAPILFFNEADAIIHKRTEHIDHAVDQMTNSIQNIILQEMESLEGIMIATTNLTQNLDRAFDRRFIYRIEFHKPEVSTKAKIWLSMMPSLTEEEANSLAKEFDLTGGEIENVVRKTKVNYILSGIDCNFETLKSICRNETIRMRESNKKKVGF